MVYQDRIGTRPHRVAAELALCHRDAAHWLARWCWTYDPRVAGGLVPFDPFPRQVEFLRWLASREAAREAGLVEKSRDMGVTWLCVAYAVHAWLFRDGFSAGFGSRKLTLVDTLGDPDSILEKGRVLLDNLPGWMLPRGFDRDEHLNSCRFVNPQNGNTITGEASEEIGRGGRKTIYFVDEAAFLGRPEMAERSLSQTTYCRIDVSTPNGPGNAFARKRHSGVVPVFSFHWRDDPRKSQEWYDEFRRRHGPVTTAQEVDIDYTASIEGIAIPAAWVRAAVGLVLPRSGRRSAGLDIAEEGTNETVLIPRDGPVVDPPVPRGPSNTTETAWWARDQARALGIAEVAYDVSGVGVGVKGTWATATEPLGFRAHAVNTGEAPTDAVWPDGRTSKELFLNLRAELWWRLRRRFERAYEHREQGVAHPPEDMISIPDDPELIAQLSLPLVQYTDRGKIQIEGKRSMRARGVKSPDRADALVLSEFDFPTAPVVSRRGPPVLSAVRQMPAGVFGPGR